MKIKLSQVMAREMKSRSISVTLLAKSTGVPRTTVHDWLEGRLPSSKNIHYLSELSSFFGISLNELLFGVADQTPTSEVLFSSSFVDGQTSYKIIVEKITTN